jgi:glutathione S-transferase
VPASRIVLYGPRGLPLTEKVGRGLRVKRLAFEVVEPGGPEDYARLSPETGLLPVLDVDGHRVPDSGAILDFLDERFPEPPLVSSHARVAREQRSLERWMDQTFSFYMLRWIRSRLGELAPSAPRGGGFPLRTLAQLGMIGPGGQLRPDVFDARRGGPGPEFERNLDHLQQLLGARPFFFADQVSRADVSVFGSLSLLYREAYVGSRAMLEARPRLRAHVERVADATGGREAV